MLKVRHNSWGEEKAEAQHTKAETQSLKKKKSDKQERRNPRERSQKQAGKYEFDVKWYWNLLIPPEWHLYLHDTLEIIRQDGLEMGQQVSKRSERSLLQLPINTMGLFLDDGNKTKRS